MGFLVPQGLFPFGCHDVPDRLFIEEKPGLGFLDRNDRDERMRETAFLNSAADLAFPSLAVRTVGVPVDEHHVDPRSCFLRAQLP